MKETRVVNRKRPLLLGWLLVLLQAAASGIFVLLIHRLDVLPSVMLAILGGILGFLWLIAVIAQCSRGAGRVLGLIYSLIIVTLLSVGGYYVHRTGAALNGLTSAMRKTVETRVSFVVLKSSEAQVLPDAKGYDFALQESLDSADMAEAQKTLKEQLGSYSLLRYENYESAAEALYQGEAQVLVLNEARRSRLLETYPDFEDDTRILGIYTYQREVVEEIPVTDVTKPFVVYVSGNDSYGEVTLDSGRSDVNILCAVNPQKKEILLVTTPRDYYIDLPVDGEYYKDKLTHAAIYGIDVSEAVLEDLYDINIDYYVRVNFSGFKNIVDALGGVEVYSDYAFQTADGKSFKEGLNQVDGDQALAFVRERYSFSDGDYQRGRNQMHMIRAIIDKITSPAILVKYLDLLDTLSDCFITDMPSQSMTQLVKLQLSGGGEWKIDSYEVHGYGNELPVYSQDGDYASVQEIDEDSVAQARSMIYRVLGLEQ